MRLKIFICLLLAGVTLAIYWPARHFGIVYYDDPLFVTETPEINAGLTWHSLWWALSGVLVANWHPVTSLSFLLTHQFFGADPGAEHLVNLVFHAANAALLFLVLNQMTKAVWRSAIVAAIFAWHPLRVESVAWISERKDVLCGFFFLLTLLAYARHAREQEAGSREPRTTQNRGAFSFLHAPFHCPALLFFALGLMSKPMAVTLPFVLLLMDAWPLKRISDFRFPISDLKPLLIEKIPFFALTILFCVATYWIQQDYAAMTPYDVLGLDRRAANAIAGYAAYPARLFWPASLAVIYPYPKSYDVTQTVLKAALLLAVSLGSLTQLARRPWLAAGWFWYLVTALPVIGLVQVGEQSMADRYTYLPLIGPVVALVWTAAEFFSRTRPGKVFLAATAVLILSALIVLSERQLQFWRDTVALFEHNVAVTPDNGSAHFTLGLAFEHAGDTNRAVVCYRVAKALSPDELQIRRNLAGLLARQGQLPAAEAEFEELLALRPDEFGAHAGLAGVFAAQGRVDEEVDQLNQALRIDPDSAEALNNLAWALATSPRAEIRDGPRAVQLAQHACELTHFEKTIFIGTLAAAYAEAGQFDDAVSTAQKATALAQKNGEPDLLKKNHELLERYRRGQTAEEK
jgi:Flp pilus assembly protein TadD